jgi:hypothetical protein
VSRKNSENVTAPTIAIVAFAPESVRCRKSRGGSSGADDLRSTVVNTSRSAVAPASIVNVLADAQPLLVA